MEVTVKVVSAAAAAWGLLLLKDSRMKSGFCYCGIGSAAAERQRKWVLLLLKDSRVKVGSAQSAADSQMLHGVASGAGLREDGRESIPGPWSASARPYWRGDVVAQPAH